MRDRTCHPQSNQRGPRTAISIRFSQTTESAPWNPISKATCKPLASPAQPTSCHPKIELPSFIFPHLFRTTLPPARIQLRNILAPTPENRPPPHRALPLHPPRRRNLRQPRRTPHYRRARRRYRFQDRNPPPRPDPLPAARPLPTHRHKPPPPPTTEHRT